MGVTLTLALAFTIPSYRIIGDKIRLVFEWEVLPGELVQLKDNRQIGGEWEDFRKIRVKKIRGLNQHVGVTLTLALAFTIPSYRIIGDKIQLVFEWEVLPGELVQSKDNRQIGREW